MDKERETERQRDRDRDRDRGGQTDRPTEPTDRVDLFAGIAAGALPQTDSGDAREIRTPGIPGRRRSTGIGKPGIRLGFVSDSTWIFPDFPPGHPGPGAGPVAPA